MSLYPPEDRSIPQTNYRLHSIADKPLSPQSKIILQPLAMRIPNRYNIYSASKLEPKKEISYEEFLSRYSDYPKNIRVCFEETASVTALLQRSEWITAYGFGFDCWYVVMSIFENNS